MPIILGAFAVIAVASIVTARRRGTTHGGSADTTQHETGRVLAQTTRQTQNWTGMDSV